MKPLVGWTSAPRDDQRQQSSRNSSRCSRRLADSRIVTLADLPAIPEPDETGATFWENARLKALAYAAASGLTAVAEDSGLEIAALGGEPGVHSARFLGAGVAVPARGSTRSTARLRASQSRGRTHASSRRWPSPRPTRSCSKPNRRSMARSPTARAANTASDTIRSSSTRRSARPPRQMTLGRKDRRLAPRARVSRPRALARGRRPAREPAHSQ